MAETTERSPGTAGGRRVTRPTTERSRGWRAPGGWELGRIVRTPEFLVLVLILLIAATLSIAKPLFFTGVNAENISRQASVLAVLSVGLMFVVVIGGIDVSVGAQMALVSIVGATLADEIGVQPAIAISILVAVAVGVVNGVLIGAIELSPIVVTIATGQVLTGIALLETATGPIRPQDEGYRALSTDTIAFLPILTVIAVGALVVGHLLLTRTRFGRYVYAVGGNETAAWLAGLPVVRVKLGAYALCGFFAGLAGALLSSRVGSGQATLGPTLMFAAYAAVFIGGVAWGGGAGTMVGAALGVLLLAVISNGLDLLQLPSAYQTIVTGALMVLAIGLHKLFGFAR